MDGEGVFIDPDNNNFEVTFIDFNEISGGNGRDILIGDRPDAATNHDLIDGGEGRDLLIGLSETDILFGGGGRDLLLGGNGDDHLEGGHGRDVLKGGQGNDKLLGGRGRDLLFGGSGQDLFGLETGAGVDRIVDYRDGVDTLGLTGGLSFEDLTITRFGFGGTLIRAGSDRLAVVLGTRPALIDGSDFTVV